MAETIYYVDAFQTTDFDDASFVEREILMTRTLCRYDPDDKFSEGSLARVTPITGSTMGNEMLYIRQECIFADFVSASATNLVTDNVIQFDSRNELSAWVAKAPISELLNYIVEAHFTSEKGKTTVKYFAEIADFEVPEDKKANVYRFDVCNKITNEVVGKLSFTTNGCKKGLNKIQRAFENQKDSMNAEDYIVLLNGVNVSGYFLSPPTADVFYWKKESEYDGARFRVEYLGARTLIEYNVFGYNLAKVLFGDKNENLDEARSVRDTKIEKLKKILDEDQRVHGGN